MLRTLFAAALVLPIAATAHAKGTATAGPVTAGVNHTYRCFAVNVSAKPVTINMKGFLHTGVEVDSRVCSDVAPNATCFMDTFDFMNTCRVDHDGGKNAVHVNLEIKDENGDRVFIVEGH